MKGKPIVIATLILVASVIAFAGQAIDGQHAADKQPIGANKARDNAGKHDLDRHFSAIEDRLKALESRTDPHVWRAGTQVIELNNAASGTATVHLKDMPKDAKILLTTKMLKTGAAFKVAYRLDNDGFLIYIEDFTNNNQSGLVEVDWAVVTNNKARAAQESPKQASKWVGEWLFDGKADQPCAILQQGRVLLLVNERGDIATGKIASQHTIDTRWAENALVGELKDDGKTVSWGNGTTWKRP